jgi:flagellar hook-basal body complex protein FliE
MAIGAISAAASGAISNAVSVPVAPKVNGVGGSDTGSFGDMVTKALDGVQKLQTKSDGLATKAATGDLNDIHDYMIASTEASLATQLTVAVRNKAVEAFNDIMRMPI